MEIGQELATDAKFPLQIVPGTKVLGLTGTRSPGTWDCAWDPFQAPKSTVIGRLAYYARAVCYVSDHKGSARHLLAPRGFVCVRALCPLWGRRIYTQGRVRVPLLDLKTFPTGQLHYEACKVSRARLKVICMLRGLCKCISCHKHGQGESFLGRQWWRKIS